MSNIRLPMAVCAAATDVLRGSHQSLEAMFEAAGVPGPPPDAPHHTKWKTWLFKAGNDHQVDSLAILGNLIEEFMDVRPNGTAKEKEEWQERRKQLASTLEEYGFTYFRGGRVLPNGQAPLQTITNPKRKDGRPEAMPSEIDQLLLTIIRGLPRAMHPLAQRRKGATSLSFHSEYDVQDLLHALLRPWIADIRPEEFTPSYAGSSTRMDFLLPKYGLVLELKLVRDTAHGRKIGDELILDVEHYRRHPSCDHLWCVIYDPGHHIPNPSGLMNDLEGRRATPDGTVNVRLFVSSP